MKLLEKGNIGNLELKNRVYMAPMGTPTEPDGSYSDRCIRYFEERAKGGTGLIITGANQVSLEYEAKACNVLETPHSFEKLNALIRRIHYNDAKICIQITPGLGRMQFTTGDVRPYSASEVGTFWFPEIKCKPYTKEQIQDLVEKMAAGAARAKAAGADAVELHGYGGYLMDQFQSSLWNKRNDEYGGDLEGRMKFSIECIKAIKNSCGEDYPVLFKFTPYHGVEGGRELDEGIKMAKMLENAGVDGLHVDVGCYEAWYKAINTVYQNAGTQIDIAAEIRKNTNVPVLSQGKLNNPELAEKVLKEEKTDFVGLGHQSLADPYWVNKVQGNETYDIIPCIGCNECLNAGFSGKMMHCSVNPQCFAEDDKLRQTKENKKVLVVGAGPGGMKSAITAAERGFEVELWEKTNQLGGNLLAAGGPEFKSDVLDYVDYLKGKVYRSNINIKMMKKATAEQILKKDYDKVILATGSKPTIPPFADIENEKIVFANDILLNEEDYGDKVVVIGGGLVGCETAAQCAKNAEEVTIIEMLEDILVATDHCKNNDQALRQLLKDSNINIIANAEIKELKDEEIKYEKDNEEKSIKADTYILATGYKANDELYDKLNAKINVSKIGDAVEPDKILDAVHQGFHIINNL